MAKQTRTFPITVARQKTVASEAVKYEISLCKWVFAQSFGSENAIASEKFVQNKKYLTLNYFVSFRGYIYQIIHKDFNVTNLHFLKWIRVNHF